MKLSIEMRATNIPPFSFECPSILVKEGGKNGSSHLYETLNSIGQYLLEVGACYITQNNICAQNFDM